MISFLLRLKVISVRMVRMYAFHSGIYHAERWDGNSFFGLVRRRRFTLYFENGRRVWVLTRQNWDSRVPASVIRAWASNFQKRGYGAKCQGCGSYLSKCRVFQKSGGIACCPDCSHTSVQIGGVA